MYVQYIKYQIKFDHQADIRYIYNIIHEEAEGPREKTDDTDVS